MSLLQRAAVASALILGGAYVIASYRGGLFSSSKPSHGFQSQNAPAPYLPAPTTSGAAVADPATPPAMPGRLAAGPDGPAEPTLMPSSKVGVVSFWRLLHDSEIPSMNPGVPAGRPQESPPALLPGSKSGIVLPPPPLSLFREPPALVVPGPTPESIRASTSKPEEPRPIFLMPSSKVGPVFGPRSEPVSRPAAQ